MRRTLISMFSALLLAASGTIVGAQEIADKILTNTTILTMDDANPMAQAIAVMGNKIIYVGEAKGAEKHKGPKTEVLDLQGKFIMPGFVSGHDHIVASNWSKIGVDLNAAKNKEETLAMLRDYVKKNPDLPMILGQGYNASKMGGYPTAAELDEIVSDKIAIIIDYTIHDAWLNTEAMKAGGITKDSPDTVPGVTYWVRDDDGNPTGVGVELAWFPTYAKVAWDPEKLISESRAFLHAEASKRGTTTALIPGQVTPNFSNTDGNFADLEVAMKLLGGLDGEGKLPIRTFMQPAYKDAKTDPKSFAERAKNVQDTYNGDRFGVRGMKIHPEGTWSSGGVLMLETWADREGRGASATSPERIMEVVLAANALGVDVFTHVEGSATVRGKIDAILASRKAGNKDERNALHHWIIVHPDDQKRTIEHKIPVNVTPIFATDWSAQDKDYIAMLGKKRVASHVGHYKALADAGVKLSISADVPSSPIENVGGLSNIYSTITFKDPFNPEGSKKFPPEGKPLELMQAIKAVTVNPAWQLRMEDKIGSLEVGKYADIVVLDRNILEIKAPEDLLETKVLATIMDGVFRHREGL